MSTLSVFLKDNVPPEENVFYAASKRFLDENGKVVEWELRCIDSNDDEKLRNSCLRTIPVPGKKNQYTKELDYNRYLAKLGAACTVFPDLKNAELQDSYNVKGEENLLRALLKPGELNDFLAKVQEVNGFEADMSELVDDAKN